MADFLRELVGFIPKKERLKLFMDFYEECSLNSREAARVLGISVRRVYFYLPNRRNNRVRNYPNDETTYLILKTLFKKNPERAFKAVKRLNMEFNRVQAGVLFKGIHQKLKDLYNIMV